jgi:hypothetical protein
MSKLQVRNVLNWHKLQVLLFLFVAELSSLCQAGSVSGQVVEMGFHSTQLLNSDKFPIVVPNSYFSNQVINLYTPYCLLGDARFGHLMLSVLVRLCARYLGLRENASCSSELNLSRNFQNFSNWECHIIEICGGSILWQVIINKSRAQWRGLSLNLPVRLMDFDKIPSITANIRSMLNSHPRVFLEKEKPRCHVSQVGPSSLIIAITCNLKPMVTHC